MTRFTQVWTNPLYPGNWALLSTDNQLFRLWNVEGAFGQEEMLIGSLAGWVLHDEHLSDPIL
jgi:hypothetical protein